MQQYGCLSAEACKGLTDPHVNLEEWGQDNMALRGSFNLVGSWKNFPIDL